MLLQHHRSRVCPKKHKNLNVLTQRVFKTAPLYAVTNPEPTATPTVHAAFTAFFESLWSPATNPDGTTVQKAGMSYVYDEDGTLIADTLTGGATTAWGQSARYIYLPTASGPMPVAAIYGTKHYAIQSDHLNTPRRLIQSDGQVAWQWAYSAFGDEKPTTAKTRFANAELNQSFGSTTVPAVTFNLRYPGQYYDQESNLHYNYHRSYSATTGRYTQADPIGLDGGWNRFGYVGQNPLGFTDPSGLIKIVLLAPNDPNYKAAVNYPDDPNMCIIIAHGGAQSVNKMNATQLNALLTRYGCKKEPVRIDACLTGAGENSIAEQLAKIRGVKVVAPDERTWTTPWGGNFGSPYPPMSLDPNSSLNNIPNILSPGNWIEFNPPQKGKK
jgi:RHS repeat-associated protein